MKIKTIALTLCLLLLPMVATAQKTASKQKKVQVKPAQKPVTEEVKLTYDAGTHELVYRTYRYKMVYVQGGSFQMGAMPEHDYHSNAEKPVHSVTLSSYYIGQTEVPQWLWVAVMGSNPSRWKGDNLPVESVSWEDCQEFIARLNNLTGQSFRLPTEAQWEYAARGGNASRGFQYSGSNGIGAVAWYKDNSDKRPHEVGKKGKNELDLYDMSGNVWEWCHDWYGDYPSSAVTDPKGASSGSFRVDRGGSWIDTPGICRVAYRHNSTPDFRGLNLGLRLAL